MSSMCQLIQFNLEIPHIFTTGIGQRGIFDPPSAQKPKKFFNGRRRSLVCRSQLELDNDPAPRVTTGCPYKLFPRLDSLGLANSQQKVRQCFPRQRRYARPLCARAFSERRRSNVDTTRCPQRERSCERCRRRLTRIPRRRILNRCRRFRRRPTMSTSRVAVDLYFLVSYHEDY